jgi:hypothetical protein
MSGQAHLEVTPGSTAKIVVAMANTTESINGKVEEQKGD